MIMSQICLKCTQYNFAPYLLNNKQKDVCQFLDSSVRPTSEFIWLVTRLTLATHTCVKWASLSVSLVQFIIEKCLIFKEKPQHLWIQKQKSISMRADIQHFAQEWKITHEHYLPASEMSFNHWRTLWILSP